MEVNNHWFEVVERNMGKIFPEIRIGEALAHSGLAVYPLYTNSKTEVDYQVAVAALESGDVSVEEVDQEGTVPHLLVTNAGDSQVFFMEGEELTGGKQNRAVNTSVLAGSKTSLRIPVSCVEAGRWGYEGSPDGPQGGGVKSELSSELNCFSPEVRKSLRDSVSVSLRKQRGHTSSQGEIWDEIKKEQDDLGVKSPSKAMKDTYDSYREKLDEFKARLKYPGRAVGLVGTIDGQVVSFDLFDKASTCESFWERLVSSFAMSRLKRRSRLTVDVRRQDQEGRLEAPDIEKFVEMANAAQWRPYDAVGEGVEYRVRTEDGMEGFALHYDGKLVHGSLLAAK